MKGGAGYESAPLVFGWKRVGSSERPFGKSLLVLVGAWDLIRGGESGGTGFSEYLCFCFE